MSKIFKNALICEQLTKLTNEERKLIMTELLISSSLRKLSEELGIPKSTLHLWVKPPKPESTDEKFIDSKIKFLINSLRTNNIVETVNTKTLLNELKGLIQ